VFNFRRRLLFPIHIEHPDEKMAALLARDLNGPDGEFVSFANYLYHSVHITNTYLRELLGMVAAEELGHWEIIAVVIRKLGFDYLPSPDISTRISVGQNKSKIQDFEVLNMLRYHEDSEIKAKQRYLKLVKSTDDQSLKKIFQFLACRETVHQKLLHRTISLVSEKAENEQFSAVIHEYKMSLRVVK